MKNSTAALIGVAVGAMAAAAYTYIFGPAPNATFDVSYRSRLDNALAEGERAAKEHEAELRRQFEESKRPRPRVDPGFIPS